MNNSLGAVFLVSMSHKYILQIPKKLDPIESSITIDDFIEETMQRIFPAFSFNMLDKASKLYYKTLIFKHMECIKTNNYYNFVFEDKKLDNLL